MLQAKHDFKENGYASINISKIFTENIIGLRDSCSQLRDDEWTFIIRNREEEVDLPYNTSQEIVLKSQKLALEDYYAEQFAFSFLRIAESHLSRPPAFNMAYGFLESNEFKCFLTKISGREIGEIETFYLNRFEQGNFLSTHCDPGENIGVALNITQGWNPNFGGLTCILDDSRKFVKDVLTPQFGELFIFDTSSNEVPHFVSMVTAPVKTNRISLIARYNKQVMK